MIFDNAKCFLSLVLTPKKMWRNKKDAYLKKKRDIEKYKCGDAAKTVNKGKFYDQMSFLDPFTTDRK